VVKSTADMKLLLECWKPELGAFEILREKVSFLSHKTLGKTAHLFQRRNSDPIFECVLLLWQLGLKI